MVLFRYRVFLPTRKISRNPLPPQRNVRYARWLRLLLFRKTQASGSATRLSCNSPLPLQK